MNHDKIFKIISRLRILTYHKKCLWKEEQVIVNDNNQTAFFKGFKVYLKSGWVFLYTTNSNTINVNIGKNDNLVNSESYSKGSIYSITKKLYNEISYNATDGDTIDLILEELS